MWVIKTCGRQFTASCTCLTLHLAERSAHLLGIRGGDVIRRSVEWMAQTSECSAKTLALSWHSTQSSLWVFTTEPHIFLLGNNYWSWRRRKYNSNARCIQTYIFVLHNQNQNTLLCFQAFSCISTPWSVHNENNSLHVCISAVRNQTNSQVSFFNFPSSHNVI